MTLKALYAAATGMDAQEIRIDNIANNLSNVNTTGFKASRECFEDLVYDQIQTPGSKNSTNAVSPVGVQIGHGTRPIAVYKHYSQGEFVQTNRELDLAIEGNGFFAVVMDDGTKAYTRDGGLAVDSTGKVVTKHGFAIEPSLTLPAETTSITIGKDGTITAQIPGQAQPQEVGKLQLTVFRNPSGLKALGRNLLAETVSSGTAATVNAGESGAGNFNQGFLENSNVNVAEELINMIVAQRMYEANSKVMTTSNEMMRASNAIV